MLERTVTGCVMELAEQVRKDISSLSLEEATQYLPKAKTSKEQFFSESKYCSLHLVLTEAVRNVLSHEKLESFLSECQVDKDVRWVSQSVILSESKYCIAF